MNINDLVVPSGRFHKLCDDIDSLEFCWKVYNDFADGKRKADQHMDMIKSQQQLLQALQRVLKRGL